MVILGLEAGIFPHSRSLLDRSELEEERRLMYVAMTRAKERLYLLHAQQRMLYGESKSNPPSQFLMDIPEELVERNFARNSMLNRVAGSLGDKPIPVEEEVGFSEDLAAGDRIEHRSFGKGIVVDVKGGVVTIAFEDIRVGVKKLALSIAPLKKI